MKRVSTLFAFLLITFISFHSYSQLSGTYTIGSGGNYANFTAATSALYSQGVSGPVTFNVLPGTYNERLNLSSTISGANATNTITFDGQNKNAVTIENTSNNYSTVRFYSVDYVTVKNMTIRNYGIGVSFTNNADHNTVENCNIIVPVSSSSTYIPIIFANSDYSYSSSSNTCGNYNLIKDNYIEGGYMGISLYAASSSGGPYNQYNQFIGNELNQQYYYGIRSYYSNGNNTYQHNYIHNMTNTTGGYGIYCYYNGGNTIDGNIINPGRYGIYIYRENYYHASLSTYITNNIIDNFGYSTYQTGIYCYYYSYRVSILHNTIEVTGTSSSYSSNTCIYAYYYPEYGVIKNNILRAPNYYGFCLALYYPYYMTIDYNIYDYPSSHYNKFYANGYYNSLSNFRGFSGYNIYTPHDQNSVEETPDYYPNTMYLNDLSARTAPKVLPSNLLHDVDGESRSANGPHAIGADRPIAMTLNSVTASTYTTQDVVVGTNLNKIIKVNFDITGRVAPLKVKEVYFETTGTTRLKDIKTIRVFDEDQNPLDTTKQLAAIHNPSSSSFMVNLNGAGIPPSNEFIVSYDIISQANTGNLLDCQLNSIMVADTMRYPTVGAPSGNRQIVDRGLASNYDTANVFVSQNLIPMLRVSVLNGDGGPLNQTNLTQIYFSTTGSSDPANDIKYAKLYDRDNNPLIITDVVGDPVMNPNGSFSWNLNLTSNGQIDLLLGYDIAESATPGNRVSARCDSMMINGMMFHVANDTGSRMIVHPANYDLYCGVTRTTTGNYAVGIKRIQFGSIDNSTQTFPGPQIYNFYTTPIPTMFVQKSYDLDVQHGELNTQSVAAYADWNNNGVFDGTERIAVSTNKPEATSSQFTVQVPCDATPGWHRVRFSSDLGAYTPVSCGSINYGEVEDYLIYVPAEEIPIVSFTTADTGYVGGLTVFEPVSNLDGNIDFIWDYDNDNVWDDTTQAEGGYVFTTGGTKTVKMFAKLYGCTDTFTSQVYQGTVPIISPPTPPVVNFISNINTTTTSIPVYFTDLTTLGPSSWKWVISPEYVNGNKAYDFYPSDDVAEPYIMFHEIGSYEVKLIATNLVGSDSTIKTEYIDVVKEQIICDDNYTQLASGYLYDDGGKFDIYTSPSSGQERACGYLIEPKCAQSITLDFLDFDVCSHTISTCATLPPDAVKIYDGVDNTGTPLHLQFLDMVGNPIYPNGYTNGPQNVRMPLPPSVTASSGSMYVEFYTNCLAAGPGFEAKWTTQLFNVNPPVAGIDAPDTVYTKTRFMVASNSTAFEPDYYWDLNGDGWNDSNDSLDYASFDSPGLKTIRLVVSSCGNVDTAYKTILVQDPTRKPNVDFAAEFVRISLDDQIMITDESYDGVYEWHWVISPANYRLLEGTTEYSEDLKIQFTEIGNYDIKLVATNAVGKDSLTKSSYIFVYEPCSPAVASLNPDIGMSQVLIQNAAGDTLSIENSEIGKTPYTDYSKKHVVTLYRTGNYDVSMTRNTNFNKITRTIYIDYNQDGDFTDLGEEVATDNNSASLDWSTTIQIPSTAMEGLTTMRIAANAGQLRNKGCGPNFSGEFEDYGVIIKTDDLPPMITLMGGDTVALNSCATYVDAGYYAWDDVAGDLTSKVKVTGRSNIDSTVFGFYSLQYNVVDNANNAAPTVTRAVEVLPDIVKPTITLNGKQTDSVAVFGTFNLPNPSYTATDNCSGLKSSSENGTINTNMVGWQSIMYIAEDNDGNIDKVYRNVYVYDDIDPTISLVGNDTIMLEVFDTYNDPGVTPDDNYYKNLPYETNGQVNTSEIGTYFLSYCVTDSSNNGPVCVDRVVIVEDNTAPVITLKGDETMEIEVFSNFADPGYIKSDNYYNGDQIIVTTKGTVNTYLLGTYQITYVATDGSGNVSAVKTRTVNVVDKTAPTIELVGSDNVTIERFWEYEDAGVVVKDNYDDEEDLTIKVNETGTFINTSVPGLYTYSYSVCDLSNNCSEEIFRTIYVTESTSSIDNKDVVELINFYPNPSVGDLTIEISLSTSSNANISIYNALGEYVMTVNEGFIKSDVYNVNLESLSSGIYYIRVTIDNNETVNKKFILTK